MPPGALSVPGPAPVAPTASPLVPGPALVSHAAPSALSHAAPSALPPASGVMPPAPAAPAPAGPAVVAPGPGASRSPDARLARVHLRGGLIPLARAALEQMAGAGTLDREAFADLAEVRWRSGDLEGAAEAAHAHLGTGGDEPIVHLILAEEHARRGRMGEAQGHAAAVYVRIGPAIDLFFAGEGRTGVWPPADPGWMDTQAASPGRMGLLVGGAEVATAGAGTWTAVPIAHAGLMPAAVGRSHGLMGAAVSLPSTARPPGTASTTTAALLSGRRAGQELEVAEQAITSGRPSAAAERLAVLLRLDPALAPVILGIADRAAGALPDGGPGLSALHVVRGDALRHLGRENEAVAAYQFAHQALGAGPISREVS
jgi:hypothetical protein